MRQLDELSLNGGEQY